MTPTEMAAKADVPLYPSSDAPDGKSNVKETDKESRYELIMTTADAPDKVLAFYRGKLQNAQKGMGGIMGSSPKGNSVTVTAAPEAGKTSIHVIAITFK
ncbi:hypothetical protein OP10G_3579 [Fimbriimonas ginsengisoli Gsoil 348]|uniref:Uncharacterized protein n=2 Tax=Fimbriimonas ginsengisoli TaxID=1005039 RepID=A0A068NUA5_FIMGI|nr:hypothetical protein OP10G_3579 [Fimbriimonas ginsengisoli Gsoil 348]